MDTFRETCIFPSDSCEGFRIVAEDNKTFCIFSGKETSYFPLTIWVFSSEMNNLIFHTAQFEFKQQYNPDRLLRFTDLSPTSKWFLTIHDEKFLLVDIKTVKYHILNPLDLKIKEFYFAKFLDDNYIVVLGDSVIYVIDIDQKKVISYPTEKFYAGYCRFMFVSQTGKICIITNRNLTFAEKQKHTAAIYETKLNFDAKLCWRLVQSIDAIDGTITHIKIAGYLNEYVTMNGIGYCFDEYRKKGIFREYKTSSKLLEVFGFPTKFITKLEFPFVLHNYKFYYKCSFIAKFHDKIFIKDSKGLCVMNLKVFAFYRFAKLIANGLQNGGQWHEFLTKGLYDPRLLIFVWDFCEEPCKTYNFNKEFRVILTQKYYGI